MKGWLLALALSLALTGCGSRTTPDTMDQTGPTEPMTTAPAVTETDGGIRTRPVEPTTGDSTYTAREDGVVSENPSERSRDGAVADGVRDVVDGTADAARDVTDGIVTGAERAADGVIDGAERMAEGVRDSAAAVDKTSER